jgi:flagella basal body P-ring formation protein FlgA
MTRVRAAAMAALALAASAAYGAGTPLAVTRAATVLEPRALAMKVSPVAHSRNATVADLVEGPLPSVLAALVVKPGLSPGVDVTVSVDLLGLKLRQVNLLGWTVDPKGPRSVLLKVPALSLPGATIRRFAQDYLMQLLSGSAGADVEPRGPVGDLRLFDDEPRLHVSLPEGLALRGNVVLKVDVMQAGPDGEDRLSASVPVGFLVRRHEGRLVSTREIHRGEALGPQNLALVDADATYESDSVDGFDKVAGKVARTFVGGGKVLARAMVDEPIAIQRGDIVRLMVHSGGVILEASAKALRDARVGESLPLQVLDTDRPVQARCVEVGVAVREAP